MSLRRMLTDRVRPSRLLPLLILLLLAPAAPAQDEKSAAEATWRQISESWYVIELQGAPAGWMHETLSDDGRRYRSETESKLKVGRGSVEIEVATLSIFLETHDGRPLEMRSVQDMAMQKVDAQWVFKDDHILSITRQGEREIEKELPLPEGDWLTPMAAHRYWLGQREGGAEEITIHTVQPEMGLKPIEITQRLQGREEYELEGETVPVTVWRTTNSLMPGIVTVEKMTEEGDLVHEEANLGFGRMITRLATKEQVLEVDDAAAPELMISTFVEPDRPIERPMQAKRMKLRVKAKKGGLPELPSAGAQRVQVEEGGTSAVLTIDVDDPLPADAGDAESAEYREPSAMADSGDALVKALAERAVREAGDDPMVKAEAMRRFVYEHISEKGLDTAFATASETARMKTGDCSEHGVLLCALLRAGGIPARVASGLVYADLFAGEKGIYGWHMWTQALIDGKWIDLDATLPVRYHAGHILTGTGSLADGSGLSDMATVMVLLGNMDVEVLEVEHAE